MPKARLAKKAKQVLLNVAQEAMNNSCNSVPKPVFHNSAGANYLAYRDIVPGITVRNQYSEADYYRFRPGEELPTTPKGIMAASMRFYKVNPIVKNTIDMMSEFAANGMVVAHVSDKIQTIYKGWLKKIDSYNVNERFVNILLKAGSTVVNRNFAKITKANLNQLYAEGADMPFPIIDSVKSEIPILYTFLNPLYVAVPHEEFAGFNGKRDLVLMLPETLIKDIKKLSKNARELLLDEFPPDMADALRKGENKIPLDPHKVSIHHYKKDDWEIWGESIHACILDDLVQYEKTKLADRTTLDSIASRIRLWKVGHLEKENNFIPNEAAFDALSDTLATIPSGGTADVLWNPAIDVIELSKDAYQFLTQEKYKAPLNAIYQGLGVPRTINDSGGFNNSYFGLKTLVERLNYARNVLKDFWQEEFKKVHKALGLPGSPPEIYFDEITITNKENIMRLIVDLADRNLLSDEEVRRLFNSIPDIERFRVRKENRRKDKKIDPPKMSPYTNGGTAEADYRKIALQKDLLLPKDLDIKSSANPIQTIKNRNAKPTPTIGGLQSKAPKGAASPGRPKNAKDQGIRKKRVVKPRSNLAFIWAKKTHTDISNLLLNEALKAFDKKNARQLSTAQVEDLEQKRLSIICNVEYGQKVTKDLVESGVSHIVSDEDLTLYNQMLGEFTTLYGKSPNTEELKDIQISFMVERLNESNSDS